MKVIGLAVFATGIPITKCGITISEMDPAWEWFIMVVEAIQIVIATSLIARRNAFEEIIHNMTDIN